MYYAKRNENENKRFNGLVLFLKVYNTIKFKGGSNVLNHIKTLKEIYYYNCF